MNIVLANSHIAIFNKIINLEGQACGNAKIMSKTTFNIKKYIAVIAENLVLTENTLFFPFLEIAFCVCMHVLSHCSPPLCL